MFIIFMFIILQFTIFFDHPDHPDHPVVKSKIKASEYVRSFGLILKAIQSEIVVFKDKQRRMV